MEEKIILHAVTPEAKKIIRKFVEEYFGQDELEKIDEIFNNVRVNYSMRVSPR